MGGVGRLLEVLERVATAAEASDIEVAILLVVLKVGPGMMAFSHVLSSKINHLS